MNVSNEKRAVELVLKLLALPGPSCEETAVAELVMDTLAAAGVSRAWMCTDNAHKKTQRAGQLGNLIVKLPGTRKGPRRMLSAHMDTVPICVGCQPKRVGALIRSSDPATGLGGDDRAGVAAILVGIMHVLEQQLPYGPLTLCFFVQEEIGLQGSRHLTVSKLGKPAMGLNLDGGNPRKLTIGATSGERLKFRLRGIPAHAGLAPQQGANAIVAASIAIAALQRDGWLGAVKKKLSGERTASVGTSNIGIIHGGNATNVVTEYVEVDAEARSHRGPFRTAIADAICLAFESAAKEVRNVAGACVQVEIERRVDYEAFKLDEKSEAVQTVAQAVRSATATEPELAVTDGGVDANWLFQHGIEAVTIGCGQRSVHTNQETLDIPDFLDACKIASHFIQAT
jgi:tripeptide aminopeptidase